MSLQWHVDPEEMIRNLKKQAKTKDDRIAKLEEYNTELESALRCAYEDEGCSEDEAIRAVAALHDDGCGVCGSDTGG